MNDTKKLTSHQQKILRLLKKNPSGLPRLTIQKHLKTSKPTTIRHLNQLVNLQLISLSGDGRATVYQPADAHPLLIPVNLKQYFKQETDQRQNILTRLNLKVFSQLNKLFSSQEANSLTKLNQAFQARLKSLSPAIYQQELERFTIELSWKSSRIEGNTYTLLETERLLKLSQTASGHSPAEAQMILNHKQAFNTITQHPQDYRPLRQQHLLNIHRHLVNKLDVPTDIRSQPVGITGTNYSPPNNQWQIKDALQKLITLVNKTPFPLAKALITIIMLSYIQPFTDGNKRTARLTANALLLAHHFCPLSYRSVDELEYKQALVLFYETNNLYPFKQIIINQLHFALDNYFKL